jgi:arabinogalactan endo-1,4-beta-galactosidase
LVVLHLKRTQGYAQSFYFGADLSYVNEMEDCGANYSIEGTAEDPYKIFSEHGSKSCQATVVAYPCMV